MTAGDAYARYTRLQSYSGWRDDDAKNIRSAAKLLADRLPALIDDFYAEIERHPETRKVITGGPAQIDRLRRTLLQWLRDLFTGEYNAEYVLRRWRVGWRHVEIGLDQVYVNMALSRLRSGLIAALHDVMPGEPDRLRATTISLNRLLDLDLALIEDAYQAEYVSRQQRIERLAAIGQIAAGIAHELRNPLNVIKTSVYYLLNARQPNAEKTAEHLRRIEKHVAISDGVIESLSNFARMPQPSVEPTSVEECVVAALDANPLPVNITVELSFPATLPPVAADGGQLRIVFGNLIRNAREAMNEGGRLRIAAAAEGSEVRVTTTDTGIGISAEHLGRIGEPLFSTKARGLGLGLSIARAILDRNRGRLSVESEPGRGSAFTVHLTVFPQEGEWSSR